MLNSQAANLHQIIFNTMKKVNYAPIISELV